MCLLKKFDLFLNKVTCPHSGKIFNLKFYQELKYIPSVEGIVWKFKRKLTGRDDLITELWNLQYNDHNLNLVIKYATNDNVQFSNSIRHLKNINKQLKDKPIQALFPRIKYAECLDSSSQQKTIATILMPHIDGYTLRDYTINFINNRIGIDKFEIVFTSCLEALKKLHALPIALETDLTKTEDIVEDMLSDKNLEGRIFERIFLKYFLKKVREKKYNDLIKEIENVKISNIHGDCFPYNIIVDESNLAHLIDWESIQLKLNRQDISQLLGSIILAFITSGYKYNSLEKLSIIIDKVYKKRLSKNIIFRISLFKAIVRFSPLTRKYFVVVPVEIGRKVKYQKVIQLKYPIIVMNYYMFIWRFFKETIVLHRL